MSFDTLEPVALVPLSVTFKTPCPLLRYIGQGRFELVSPFVALVQEDGQRDRTIVVPAGFVTDFESVPRTLPFAYAAIKLTAVLSSILHDFIPRSTWGDRVFYFAMIAEGTPAAAREMAYAGVALNTAWKGEQHDPVGLAEPVSPRLDG